jgi:excinuclease ABC subunit C
MKVQPMSTSCKFPRFHHSIPHYGNQKKLDETDEELLELAIIELRERFHCYRVIVPFHVDLGENIKITVPQLGDKKILDLSVRNAKFYRIEQLNNCKL